MSDPSLTELAILRELGDDLKQAFRAGDAAADSRRGNPRVHSRWLVRTGGLAAAVAVAVILAFALEIQGGHLSAPSAAAARALHQAAAAAEHHPVPFPRDDQFYYLRSLTTGGIPIRSTPWAPLTRSQIRTLPRATVTWESRSWFSATRTGLTKARVISTVFPSASAHQVWERLGRPSLLAQPARPMAIAPLAGARYLLGNIELTRQQLLAFTTNPRTLYSRLYAAGGSPAEVFTEIGDTLRSRPAPAALRAGLFRALALVPGVRFVGNVHDRAGRTGTTVGFVHDNGVEDELIFDPRSSDLLAERSVVVDARGNGLGLSVGAVAIETTYLQRAVTDRPSAP